MRTSTWRAALLAVLFIAACNRPVDFSPPGGGFTVKIPGEVKEEQQSIDTPAGSLVTHIYSSKVNSWGYTVGYLELPSGLTGLRPDAMFDGVRAGLLRRFQASLISDENVIIDGHPGREIRAEVGERVLHFKVTFVGAKLYQIGVATPKDDASSPKLERFIESLRITQ